uniref:Reverse transcriptase RNase H-like domain-containing protein n=1 Tax=Tanacetum cinerariifolium TaxID=118510 RepID=A0A699L862_TANCI|nr:hypothetical protein [Tanacetum cinerariifolium]
MSSLYECEGFTWTLQGLEFTSDVFILPLGGCELVLGVQWLSILGDIKWNFKDLIMDFVYNDRRMVLRGTQKVALQWMSGKKQSKATSNGQLLCVYPNTLFSITQTTTSPPCSQITELLDSYQDVFVTPTSLSPKRKHDHRIPLVPNTPLINIRPYKHPPNQKGAVEVMVQELMASGVIRDSQSPYSSPIFMVKKKDGTWRMCVDYRQLNKYTVKDKFPIPVVEELLDELSGAQFFSKLDLSATFQEHLQHLQLVLQAMRQNSLYAKMSKCNFAAKQVEYLGHIFFGEGVSTDPSKIIAMQKWPTPASFEALKVAMSQASILALPDFNKPFTVEIDASGMGIGAVLQQGGHHIAYLSKSLSPKHHALSTYEKEFYAVLMALEKWRGYLLDRHFKIKTDHFSLKYLLDQRLTTPFQAKWLPKLLGYDYEISHKQGSENHADDALSRISSGFELCSLILSTVDLIQFHPF